MLRIGLFVSCFRLAKMTIRLRGAEAVSVKKAFAYKPISVAKVVICLLKECLREGVEILSYPKSSSMTHESSRLHRD